MATTFTFPPPPPPPPKATIDPGYVDSIYSQNNQRGGRGGGRGLRGRGRGFHQQDNAGRGGYGMQGGYAPNNVGNSQFTGGPGYNMPWSMIGTMPQHASFSGTPASRGAHMVSQSPYFQQNAQPQPFQSSHALFNQSPFPSTQSFYPQPNQGFNHAPFGTDGQYHVSNANGYASQSWRHSVPQVSTKSQSMGPPLRIGFSQNVPVTPSGFQEPLPYSNSSAPTNTYGSTQPFSQYKRKREGNQNSRGTFQNRGNFLNGNNRPAKKPKVEVAPAVPSFGAPLPSKPIPSSTSSPHDSAPGDASNAKKRKKRKRKTNQLGLTPQGEDHEESEEDVDEEALFLTNGGPLQFEYNGKTSVLGSGADIAAWVEERKRRWPTKARVEELRQVAAKAKLEQAEARAKMQELRHQDQEAWREEQEKAKREADEARHKKQQMVYKKVKEEKSDERRKKDLERHLMKAEKLRKRLEKSELKAARLAAAACAGATAPSPVPAVVDNPTVKANVDVENTEAVLPSKTLHGDAEDGQIEPEVQAESNRNSDLPSDVDSKAKPMGTAEDIIPPKSPCQDVATFLNEATSHTMAVAPATIVVAPELESFKTEDGPEAEDSSRLDRPAMATNATNVEDPVGTIDLPSLETLPNVERDNCSDVSASSDSSMSSSSSSESASDSDSSAASTAAPNETSSRSNGPIRVSPPKRELTKRRICRKFLANGYCPLGDKCRYRHELPERGSRREKPESTKGKGRDKPAEKRISLYQRLVEQEQAEENKLVLMAIKTLGEDGFFEGTAR